MTLGPSGTVAQALNEKAHANTIALVFSTTPSP